MPDNRNKKTIRINNNQRLLLKMMEEIDGLAILLLDKNGKIETWNKGAEKIKGYKAGEIIGQNFSIFYSEADRQKGVPAAILAEAASAGTTYHESWRIRKDGTEFWGLLTLMALRDENNELMGYAKVTRDLTEKMLAEITIRQQVHDLELKNKELEQFAYIASHDLQEPLLTITNFVELIQSEYSTTLDENSKVYFDFITQAATRMKCLIKGLLDFSRIGSENVLAAIDCNQLLDDLQQDLAASIAACGARIEYDNLPVIEGYPIEMRQLFQNLIANAIKFREKNKPPLITILSATEEAFWWFAIADNGIGIDEKFTDKIFRLFKRVHTRDIYEGNGIGLAHCKKIIETLGGKITVESELGRGSTFYFTIPRKTKND